MEYIVLLSIITVIIIIVAVITCKRYIALAAQKKKEYQYWQDGIDALRHDTDNYKDTCSKFQDEIKQKENNLSNLNEQYNITKNHLDNLKQIAKDNEARLEEEYNDASQQYQDKLNHFKESCNTEMALIQIDLDSLKKTRHAAIELWRKEEQNKNQLDGYKLNITPQDKKDIKLLQNIQLQFSHPRVISKLIWQTYFQPLAKQQFIMILGNTTKCGIYKITNIINNKCYIGQSVDIYKRWCDHCKCGCGIDTPKNNKLYIAMLEDGLENFTFELLEECPREELNKKEAFYISLYESNDYGYNQTAGNS